jgi:transposase-like protein
VKKSRDFALMNERRDGRVVTLSRFEKVAPKLLEAVKAGATVAEGCRKLDISPHTVRSWLANGRRDREGRYGEFAGAIDAAKRSKHAVVPASPSDGLSREEWERLLAEAVRAGSVPAMKLWADTHPVDGQAGPVDPLAFLDQLVQQRRQQDGAT